VGSDPTRIALKIDARKPFVVADQYDMQRQMRKLGVNMGIGNPNDTTARKIRDTLLANGYDAIEVTTFKYFIPLNQDQVAVFETKKL
jgi:hypothetical protein